MVAASSAAAVRPCAGTRLKREMLMDDQQASKVQLLNALEQARRRVAELERTIQETLQPEGVRVWMRKE